MYTRREIENALVFDIETASAEKDLNSLREKNSRLADLWLEKFHNKYHKQELEKGEIILPEGVSIQNYIYTKCAGLIPEFSKVICISIGLFLEGEKSKDSFMLEIQDICNNNELELLDEFKTFIDNLTTYNLAGFNIKGFDVPFLCKRYLINGISLPELLKIKGKKPWEMKFIDLMEDWKFGGMNNTSLDLLVTTLGIQTPKDEIQNHEVGLLYHKDKSYLEKISKYCGKDVKATMEAMLKISSLKLEKQPSTKTPVSINE